MEQSQPNESQILADFAQLRDRFSHTQTLYKEVAALLFFRYGVTPTANKLYQLVRKGSMSAPAQALQTFWEDLRDKSRVRLDVADMPEELQTLTGDLLGRLWQEAIGQSKQQMLHYQTQADERVAQAQAQNREAQQELEVEQGALKNAQATIEQLKEALQTT
ncbi:DNA-binding protein, partial [Acinetobacter baumannii]|uniref:DNA-binding protein n=1 Tax=Acinetobacter baumannii TaxID=470 RepID=UPI000B2D9AA2